MATLKKHGAVLAKFSYSSYDLAVMEDGHILRNFGDGWKLYRKAKPGVSAQTIVAKRKALYEARRKACPFWFDYIAGLKALTGSLEKRGMIHTLVEMMPGDADGVWAMLEDHGVHASLDELVDLCRNFQIGEKELREYNAARDAARTATFNSSI